MDKKDTIIKNLKDDLNSKSSLNNDLNKKIKEITSAYQKCNSTLIQTERNFNNLQIKMNDLSNQLTTLKTNNAQLSLSYKTKTEIELEQRKQLIKLEKNISLLKESNDKITKSHQELTQSTSLSKIELLKLEAENKNLTKTLQSKINEINDTTLLTKKLFTDQEDHLQQIKSLHADNNQLIHQINLLNSTLLSNNEIHQREIKKHIDESKDSRFLNKKYKYHIDLLSQALQEVMINNSTHYATIQRNIMKEVNSNNQPVQSSSSLSSFLQPEYLICPSNDIFYQLKFQLSQPENRNQFTAHLLNDYNHMGSSYYIFNIGIISFCFLVIIAFLRRAVKTSGGEDKGYKNSHNKTATTSTAAIVTDRSQKTAQNTAAAVNRSVMNDDVNTRTITNTASTTSTVATAISATKTTNTISADTTHEKENINSINTTVSTAAAITSTANTTITNNNVGAATTTTTAPNSMSFNRISVFLNRQQNRENSTNSRATVDTRAVTELSGISGTSACSDSEASTPRKATLSVPFTSFYVSHNRSNDADDEGGGNNDESDNFFRIVNNNNDNNNNIPSVEVSLSRSTTPPLITSSGSGSGSGNNSLRNSSSSTTISHQQSQPPFTSSSSSSLTVLRSQKYHGHIVYDTDDSDFDLTPPIRPNLNTNSFYVPNKRNNNNDEDWDSDKILTERNNVLTHVATTTTVIGNIPSTIDSSSNNTHTPIRNTSNNMNNKTPVSNISATSDRIMKTPKTVNKAARTAKNRNSGVKFTESTTTTTTTTTRNSAHNNNNNNTTTNTSTASSSATTGTSIATLETTLGADDSVVVSQAPESDYESDCGSEDSTPRATGTQISPINYYRGNSNSSSGGRGVGNNNNSRSISRNSSPDANNRKIPDLKLASSANSGTANSNTANKNKVQVEEEDVTKLVTDSFMKQNIHYNSNNNNYSSSVTTETIINSGSCSTTTSGSNSQEVTPRIILPITSRSVKLSAAAPTTDSGRSIHNISSTQINNNNSNNSNNHGNSSASSILGDSAAADSRSVTPRVNHDHTSRSSTPRSNGPYRNNNNSTSCRSKNSTTSIDGGGGNVGREVDEEEIPSSRDVTPRLNGRLLKEDGLTISRSASHSRDHSVSPLHNDNNINNNTNENGNSYRCDSNSTTTGSREVTPRRIQPSSRSITPGPSRHSHSATGAGGGGGSSRNGHNNNNSSHNNNHVIVNSSHSSHHNSHNNNNNNRRYRQNNTNNNNGTSNRHHDQDIDGDDGSDNYNHYNNYNNDIDDDNASDSRSVTPRLRTPSINALPSSRSVTPRARSHHSHSTRQNEYITTETTSRSATPVLVTSPRTPSHPHSNNTTTTTTLSSLTLMAATNAGVSSGSSATAGTGSSNIGSPTVPDRKVNNPSSYIMSMLNNNITTTSTASATVASSNNTTSTSSTVSVTHK